MVDCFEENNIEAPLRPLPIGYSGKGLIQFFSSCTV